MDEIDEAMALFDQLEADPPAMALTPQALFNELRDGDIHKVVDPQLKRVVDELGHIAFANVVDLWESETVINMDVPGDPQVATRLSLKNLTELPREITAAIQSVKINADGEVEIKMCDKQGALDKLMKHHGGYAKENEQKASAHDKLLDMLFLGAEADGMPVPKSNDA